MRKLTCTDCGAVYRGHAEYCNACGSTSFETDTPGSTGAGPSLRGDQSILLAHGTLWLVSVLFFVGARHQREPMDLVVSWLATASLATVATVVTRHVRVALLFAGLGAALFGAAALLAYA